MASRAILRRRTRTSIQQYLNNTSQSSSSISSFRSIASAKEELLNYSPVFGQVVRRFTNASSSGNGFAKSNVFNESIGVRFLSQSSEAAARKKEEPPENDDVVKKRKEASPEECDQAVEGLTEAKAKAKAKRSQEAQKDAQSVVQRVRAVILGIGPALRAVASMSR
jgi:LETM1 and EF-hand domain-containing protein 1, mitochondrial